MPQRTPASAGITALEELCARGRAGRRRRRRRTRRRHERRLPRQGHGTRGQRRPGRARRTGRPPGALVLPAGGPPARQAVLDRAPRADRGDRASGTRHARRRSCGPTPSTRARRTTGATSRKGGAAHGSRPGRALKGARDRCMCGSAAWARPVTDNPSPAGTPRQARASAASIATRITTSATSSATAATCVPSSAAPSTTGTAAALKASGESRIAVLNATSPARNSATPPRRERGPGVQMLTEVPEGHLHARREERDAEQHRQEGVGVRVHREAEPARRRRRPERRLGATVTQRADPQFRGGLIRSPRGGRFLSLLRRRRACSPSYQPPCDVLQLCERQGARILIPRSLSCSWRKSWVIAAQLLPTPGKHCYVPLESPKTGRQAAR